MASVSMSEMSMSVSMLCLQGSSPDSYCTNSIFEEQEPVPRFDNILLVLFEALITLNKQKSRLQHLHIFKGSLLCPFLQYVNVGLRCPQIVSVKFQLKIPHRSFMISF